MTTTQKEQLRIALEEYIAKHNLSQNDFVKQSGINVAYISAIMQGSDKVGNSIIKDKWYNMIAEAIDFKLKKDYWKPRETDQLLRILATLEDARKHGSTNVIIGETGSGKSYACELFQKRYRSDVFIIKLGASDKIGDVLDKTIRALKMPVRSNMKLTGSYQTSSKSSKIRRIIEFLHKMKMEGFYPTVIWDESEYMNLATLCAIKEFYDELRRVAALILIGTDQLTEKLEKLKTKNKPGMPQFYSRIKFGIRELNPIDRKFTLFLDEIKDREVKDLVKKNCENYREVHDLLVPALREADRLNIPLSAELIRKHFGFIFQA